MGHSILLQKACISLIAVLLFLQIQKQSKGYKVEKVLL